MSSGAAYKAMAQRQISIASVAASLMKPEFRGMFDFANSIEHRRRRRDARRASRRVSSPLGGRNAGGTSQVQRNIIGARSDATGTETTGCMIGAEFGYHPAD